MLNEIAKASKATVLKIFYDALVSKDSELLLSLCTEDATLMWAFYYFKGKEEIQKWAREMEQHFFKLKIEHSLLSWEKDSIVHKFNLIIVDSNGRKGLIPSVGKYEFKNEKFQHIWINPIRGSGDIFITQKDLI